jgi:hypothetical protein
MCVQSAGRLVRNFRLMGLSAPNMTTEMTGEAGEQLFEDYPLSGQSVAARVQRWACRCAPSGDNSQEMQVRSFSAVRVLV